MTEWLEDLSMRLANGESFIETVVEAISNINAAWLIPAIGAFYLWRLIK